MTINVTASFGSLPPAPPRAFRVLRLVLLAPAFLALGFAIMAGIVT
jgi:hypothetical protein